MKSIPGCGDPLSGGYLHVNNPLRSCVTFQPQKPFVRETDTSKLTVMPNFPSTSIEMFNIVFESMAANIEMYPITSGDVLDTNFITSLNKCCMTFKTPNYDTINNVIYTIGDVQASLTLPRNYALED